MAPSPSLASSSCRVWVMMRGATTSQPCRFGTSVLDTLASEDEVIIATRGHYDCLPKIAWREDATRGLYLRNGGANNHDDKNDFTTTTIPMGRARACAALGSPSCPTTVTTTTTTTTTSTTQQHPRRQFVNLAVVGLLLDPTGQSMLLTRRPSYMRSFPGAWVLPGGSVDDTDASLAAAASREVQEETGLRVPASQWQAFGLWESVYPTVLNADTDYQIKAHHVVVYLAARLENQQHMQDLYLCDQEVDGAAWLSREQVWEILQNTTSTSSSSSPPPDTTITMEKRSTTREAEAATEAQSSGNHEPVEIPLQELFGIYPIPKASLSAEEDGHDWCGTAQGTVFALEEFCQSNSDWTRPNIAKL